MNRMWISSKPSSWRYPGGAAHGGAATSDGGDADADDCTVADCVCAFFCVFLCVFLRFYVVFLIISFLDWKVKGKSIQKAPTLYDHTHTKKIQVFWYFLCGFFAFLCVFLEFHVDENSDINFKGDFIWKKNENSNSYRNQKNPKLFNRKSDLGLV